MKQAIKLSACLLAACALIITSCKKDEEEPVVVPPPTPTVPQAAAVVFHANMNGTTNPTVGSATVDTSAVTWTADRFGTANQAAMFDGAAGGNGTGNIVEYSGNFIHASTTISAWYKINPATFGPGSRFMFGIAAERGMFMEIAGDQNWMKLATAHKVDESGTPDHLFGTGWTDYLNGGSPVGGQLLYNYNNPDGTGMSPLIEDTDWHHIVMTYDHTSGYKTFYIDGVKVMQADINLDATEWVFEDFALFNQNDDGTSVAGVDNKLSLGFAASRDNTATGWTSYYAQGNTFQGAMDDFRIWNVALSETEVAALYDFEN